MEELDKRWINASIPQEHWHFHSALHKRYGIVLAPGEFTRMFKAIRTKRARVIEHRKHGVTVFLISFPRVGERVFVKAKGEHIITALPPSKKLNALRRQTSDPEPVVETPGLLDSQRDADSGSDRPFEVTWRVQITRSADGALAVVAVRAIASGF